MSKAHDVESRPKMYKRISPNIFTRTAAAAPWNFRRVRRSANDVVGAQHREPYEKGTSTSGAKSRQPRDADTSLNGFTGVTISLAHDLVGAWHKCFHSN